MNLEFPQQLKITKLSINKILSISFFTGLIPSAIVYFVSSTLDVKLKIIIILLIFFLISLIDIFLLYLCDREQTYAYFFLQSTINFIEKEQIAIKQEIKDLRIDYNQTNKDIEIIKAEITKN